MIDKIKSVLNTIKSGILYVIGPVLAIVGYILYLTRKNTALQDQINQSKAAEQLATVIQKKVEDEKQSNVDESDYNTLRDKFLAESGSTESLTNSGPLHVIQGNVPTSDPSGGQSDSSQKPSA